jgi:uncharacterized protein (DUF488 family)
VNLYTIGFTQKSAEHFFGVLRNSGARRLVDVRLNNVSQLAGFAKKQDLAYFVGTICSMEYEHAPSLAPTKAMLDDYKKNGGRWDEYEQRFLALMAERRIEKIIPRESLADACLLCSEHKPHHCHRRLVAEYLQQAWENVKVHHLI